MVLGTILIAGGAILIAFFGIVPEQTRSLEDLLQLFRRPAFVAYFSVLGAIVFGCLALTHLGEYSLSRKYKVVGDGSLEAPSPTLEHSTGDDIRLASNPSCSAPKLINKNASKRRSAKAHDQDHEPTERTPLLVDRSPQQGDQRSLSASSSSSSPSPPPPVTPSEGCDVKCNTTTTSTSNSNTTLPSDHLSRMRLLLAVSYASFSGIISGMCLIFAKSGVELLLLTLGGENQFWRWESWVLLLGLVVFALLQLWYLHKALVLADPTLVCPSAFCFYNLSSIVNGLVYFNQFSLITTLHLCLVMLGIVVLLAGVWVVSIQAGPDGVDVGTWDDEDIGLVSQVQGEITEESEEETTAIPPPIIEVPEVGKVATDEGLPLSQSPTTPTSAKKRKPPLSPPLVIGMDRTARSESSLPNIALSPSIAVPPSDAGLAPTDASAGAERRSSGLYVAPRSPSQFANQKRTRRSTTDQNYSSTSSGAGRLFHGQIPPTIHPAHQPHQHVSVHPSVGGVGVPGFMIGLSPVSPGFTILPVDRRRISGVLEPSEGSSTGMGGNVISGAGRRKIGRRRTLSEGGVSRQRRREDLGHAVFEEREVGPDGNGGYVGEEEGLLRSGNGTGGDPESGSITNVRQRWDWVRRMFLRK